MNEMSFMDYFRWKYVFFREWLFDLFHEHHELIFEPTKENPLWKDKPIEEIIEDVRVKLRNAWPTTSRKD